MTQKTRIIITDMTRLKAGKPTRLFGTLRPRYLEAPIQSMQTKPQREKLRLNPASV